MAAVVKWVINMHHYLNVEVADPRTSHLPLLNHPIKMIIFLLSFSYFVNKLGPDMMKNRKPFNLERVILLYDALQVVFSLYLSYKGFVQAWGPSGGYNWICQPLDWEPTPKNIAFSLTVYQYFLLKLVDLLDTVFFVLRKKNTHISFLHVYHHLGMVVLGFAGAKWLPGGHLTLLGFLNCIVHAVMYSYYMISTLYPSYRRNIWWKKYITQLQLVQFLMIIAHTALLAVQPNCKYPKFTIFVLAPQTFVMLLMFVDFYRRAYRNKTESTKVSDNIVKEQ